LATAPESARPADAQISAQIATDFEAPAYEGSYPDEAPLVSVVIPTKEEAGNVGLIVSRLERVMPDVPIEVIFVDDSDDETPDAIRAIESTRAVRLLHRPAGEREGGLGGAVVAGMHFARGDWVCVMDGDLQHPPEVLQEMLVHARQTASQLVVASRFCAGGDIGAFRRVRKALSKISSRTAHTLFSAAREVTDPMSGFFLVKRDAVDLESLHPHGFKILLEILIRTPGLRVSEVPFRFGERHSGKTKASLLEGFRYLSQLGHLEAGRLIARFGRFGVVGLSGLVVNTVLLAVLADVLNVYYVAAAVLATQGSTLWNFGLTEAWVFSDRRHKRPLSHRLSMFLVMNNAALVLRIPLLFVLTSGLGVHYLVSNLISLGALTVLRFAVADTWIWKTRGEHAAAHCYDIHGLITVSSEVALPELARFAVEESFAQATISVRIRRSEPIEREDPVSANGNGSLNGHASNGHVALNGDGTPNGYGTLNGSSALSGDAVPSLNGNGGMPHVNGNGHDGSGMPTLVDATDERRLRYVEGPGRFGFGIEIEQRGDHIEVAATPLLEHSPHVLYTNVVEPILRWKFASMGYALVHGACFADGDRAIMVTAKTDTGKTTTTLKLLDRKTYSFLSDDLTIICPDGRVLAYPKPLTISRHTLHAVNSPLLTRRERIALIVQSRIHSRTGRRIAFVIGGLRIPAATVNAMVQRIVPPPKYQIDRLIPTAQIAPEAQLDRLFVIERGHDREETLTTREAVSTLMENCEDAFGFPPYGSIEGFLRGLNGTDLKLVERALSQVPATMIGSSTMDWWKRLAPAAAGTVEV
jgi:dolichol-phosphate mannosyltransferase